VTAVVSAVAVAAAVLVSGGVRRHVPPAPDASARGGPARNALEVGAATGGSARSAPLLVGTATALVVALLAPGWLGAAAPVAGAAAWSRARRLEPAAVRRRRVEVERELPHVVDLVRALVVAGAAPDRALALTTSVVSAPTASELRPCVRRLELGSDPVQVWLELSAHPQLGRLGVSLHRAVTSGAAVGDALQRLADDLRAGLRADVHRRVRQVEVRATAPLGACLLPAFVLLGVVPLVAGTARGLLAG
jgi:Flp pilus assembly protein TadB